MKVELRDKQLYLSCDHLSLLLWVWVFALETQQDAELGHGPAVMDVSLEL